MDRPKLYLVPPAPLPMTPPVEKNVLHFGRLWPRNLSWRESELPAAPAKPAPTVLRAVPPRTPESPPAE